MRLYIVKAEYNGQIIPIGVSPTEYQANRARDCLQQVASEDKTIEVKYHVSDCMINPYGYTDLTTNEMICYQTPWDKRKNEI